MNQAFTIVMMGISTITITVMNMPVMEEEWLPTICGARIIILEAARALQRCRSDLKDCIGRMVLAILVDVINTLQESGR